MRRKGAKVNDDDIMIHVVANITLMHVCKIKIEAIYFSEQVVDATGNPRVQLSFGSYLIPMLQCSTSVAAFYW